MAFQIVPFGEEYLDDASRLVTNRYKGLRNLIRYLPQQYEHAESIHPLLQETIKGNQGVIALRGSQPVGFLMGQVMPSFRGRRTVYCPEWAHAADLDGSSRAIYQEMYTALSAEWTSDKCSCYLITLLADDRAAIDGWFWEGFGLDTVDALRDLRQVEGGNAELDLRQAELGDVGALLSMGEGLQRHLTSPPTFVGDAGGLARGTWERQILSEGTCIMLALQEMTPVGYMRIQPANPNACYIIRDEKTASITGAFTDPNMRGRGVGTALLNGCVEWARTHGYVRCAVDFESMNVVGSRFWLRHFDPICFTVMRIVEEEGAD